MPVNWLLPAGLVLIFDQLSKKLALARLSEGHGSRSTSGSIVRVVSNAKIGLGLVNDRRMLILLWAIAAIGTTQLIERFVPLQGRVAQLGLGAALGGATSNFMDMLWRGAVVDFIDLRIWPVFNLADISIVLGIAVTLSVLVFG
jgi:signal peptidase II